MRTVIQNRISILLLLEIDEKKFCQTNQFGGYKVNWFDGTFFSSIL